MTHGCTEVYRNFQEQLLKGSLWPLFLRGNLKKTGQWNVVFCRCWYKGHNWQPFFPSVIYPKFPSPSSISLHLLVCYLMRLSKLKFLWNISPWKSYLFQNGLLHVCIQRLRGKEVPGGTQWITWVPYYPDLIRR